MRRGYLRALLPMSGQSATSAILSKMERILGAADYRDCYDLIASCWPRSSALASEGGRERIWPEMSGLSAMLLSDQSDYLPGDSLAKVDRASMAVSLETRLPLLDHRVVEYSWRVPDEMKLRSGRTKWIMRTVLDRLVPRSLTEREKMGFTVPIDQWLGGSLRVWARDMIASAPFREAMGEHHSAVIQAWDEYHALHRPSGYQIWALVVLAAWLPSLNNS